MYVLSPSFLFFFFNDTATTEIYTLSLHDALPIYGPHYSTIESIRQKTKRQKPSLLFLLGLLLVIASGAADRKSTRLNSSHQIISYAVFCLKKKNLNIRTITYGNITTIVATLYRIR